MMNNFDIEQQTNNYGIPYDFTSIMHYGPDVRGITFTCLQFSIHTCTSLLPLSELYTECRVIYIKRCPFTI